MPDYPGSVDIPVVVEIKQSVKLRFIEVREYKGGRIGRAVVLRFGVAESGSKGLRVTFKEVAVDFV
jgi:hypothetical protein